MSRIPRIALPATAMSLALAMASATQAATMAEVPVATWSNGITFPSYMRMYVYVPDKLAAKPPIVVSNHSCGNTASGQFNGLKTLRAASDKFGFLMILPDNPGRNCWDVGSKEALTHNGKGDPHAVAQMVRYALGKYGADPSRVYVLGGSSGAMLTQALLAIYPELFVAGSARAGVPAGCWAEGYTASNQWSGSCAGGKVSKTPQQWGDLVRSMQPGYSGRRPRVQLFHGDADATIKYPNLTESVKEWTNVLGLKAEPSVSGNIKTPAYAYVRQSWKNACGYTTLEAWTATGQGHAMTYEEDSIIKFFGLEIVDGKDPELAACGSTSSLGREHPVESARLWGRNLVLTSPGARTARVRILDSRGRRLGEERVATFSATSIGIPLASLQPGAYIAIVDFSESLDHPRRHTTKIAIIAR